MKKKWMIIGVIVIVVLFIGINVWQQSSTKTIEVETAKLKEATMAETVMTPGTLTLEKEQYIYFQPEKGEVDEILVKEGDKVKEGDEVLHYTNEELVLQQKQNDLQAQSASLEVEKLRKEHAEIDKELDKDPDNEALKAEHDEISMQHKSANLELEQANLQKESAANEQADLTEKADVSGTVLSVDEKASTQGEVGEKAIVRIGSLNKVVVEGTISEYETLNIEKDQKVTLTSDALPDEEWKGKISYIGDLPEENGAMGADGDDESVLYPIRVALDDDIDVKPGFNMLIEVITNEADVDTLPIAAVEQEEENNFVYVLKDGKAERVNVEVGAVDTEKMEIKDGIAEDDEIIVTQVNELSPGMEVTVQ